METQNNTSKEAPKITKTEVVKWENDFREKVSPLVKFDQQDNGYSMKFYNGESGLDAYWSGIIVFKADNYLKWNFSMLNGVFMDSKMSLDENNQRIPANLYDFFKAWQTEVAKAITEPGKESQSDVNNPAMGATETNLGGPELSGPESNNAQPEGGNALAEGSLISNVPILKNKASKFDDSRKNKIMDSAERMRRLAGL